MLTNRSVPVDTVLPHVTYKNLPEAIDWLSRTLGFVEHYRYGDPVSGAQVRLGQCIDHGESGARRLSQSGRARVWNAKPDHLSSRMSSSTLRTAKAPGQTIVEDLHETEYGELQYAVDDLGRPPLAVFPARARREPGCVGRDVPSAEITWS